VKKSQYLIALGEEIRRIRKIRGLSQEQLAFQAEVDRSYIGGVERGERNVSFLTLVRIAKSLGCDIAELTKGNPINN
jgi:transcriptional regulator with XRE-family HTH domain